MNLASEIWVEYENKITNAELYLQKKVFHVEDAQWRAAS